MGDEVAHRLQEDDHDRQNLQGRRKMDIGQHMQAIIALIALTGGGLGWYQTVVAESAARLQVQAHNQEDSSHYAGTQRIEKRLDTHDKDLIQIKADVAATVTSAQRIEKTLDQQSALLAEILRKLPPP